MGQIVVHDVCDAALPVTSQWVYNLLLSITAGCEVIAILIFVYMHRKSKLLQQAISKSPVNHDPLWNEEEDDVMDDHHSPDPPLDRNQKATNGQKSMGYQSPDITKLSFSSEHEQDDQSPISRAQKHSLTEPDRLEIDDDTDDDQRENSYYNESQNRYFQMKANHHNEIHPKKRRSFFKWSRKDSKIPLHRLSDLEHSLSEQDKSLQHHSRSRNQTMNMIEENMDKYRIFFVLLPIYWRFLWILWGYCLYKMVYMALLAGKVGADFGVMINPFGDDEYVTSSSLSTSQIVNFVFFGIFEFIESTISHIVTFWFLQPSSGLKSLKIALIPASIVGIADAICTVFAVINVQHRGVLLVFHCVMLLFYVVLFFYMILNQKLRWRLFYFYIVFFIVLYILYALGDGFVLITKGSLDGCMTEMAEFMFQFCVPVVLALLLFDDSSYWLQLSTELIGDKKDYILIEHSVDVRHDSDHLLIKPPSSSQGSDHYDDENGNGMRHNIYDNFESDLFINHNALHNLGLVRHSNAAESESKSRALLGSKSKKRRRVYSQHHHASSPKTPSQRRASNGSMFSEPVISQTKHLYIPKLQQSVGRFDSKANFDRVIDQLSMTIHVIKKSEIEFLGDSGFGSYSAVKKAKFIKTGELLAVKSLYSFDDANHQYVVEFMREAFLSQRLRHQNIVDFKGVLADRPHLCLVYEYMTHGSVFEYIQMDYFKHRDDIAAHYKAISLLTRIKFAVDAAKGIQCLHSRNIIHRDINCRNLLVTEIKTRQSHSKEDNHSSQRHKTMNNDNGVTSPPISSSIQSQVLHEPDHLFASPSSMNLYESQSISREEDDHVLVRPDKVDKSSSDKLQSPNFKSSKMRRPRLVVKVCDFGTCRLINRQHFTPTESYTPLNEEKQRSRDVIDDSMLYEDSMSAMSALNMNASIPRQNTPHSPRDRSDHHIHSIRQSSNSAVSVISQLSKQMTTGIGTVAYMAPEILKYVDFSKKLSRENKRDKIQYDFAIDVYSFGCVLYELMASKELYEDLKTANDVQQFVLQGQREEIPSAVVDALGIPSAYSELMHQCWSTSPARRPHFKDIIVRLQNIARSIKSNRRQKRQNKANKLSV